MKGIEFFAGSRSIGKSAESFGLEVLSTDSVQYGGIHYVVDVLEFDYNKVDFVPDFIWLSPPCTAFSVASIGYHWKGGSKAYVPKSETANLGLLLAKKTVQIVNHYLSINPNLIYFIENPRGLLRKMPFMEGLPKHTVWYCTYGDDRAKPTDIWTNSKKWKPRTACFNGNNNCHHAPAPRGSKTGTQGLKNAHERSKIPKQLCDEIIKSIIN